MHGKGVFTWPDGKKFVGDYKNDKKDGNGTYWWTKDKYYEGEWVNSKQHGKGKYVFGNKTQEGQFRYGKIIKRFDGKNVENAAENGNGYVDEARNMLNMNENKIHAEDNERIENPLYLDDEIHNIESIGNTKSPDFAMGK